MHQGHRVLHSSTHGPMEQGKDIIMIGLDGACHAYQTKTGDITLTELRAIAGEIQELACVTRYSWIGRHGPVSTWERYVGFMETDRLEPDRPGVVSSNAVYYAVLVRQFCWRSRHTQAI